MYKLINEVFKRIVSRKEFLIEPGLISLLTANWIQLF